jgi:uncharacterized membrane protein YqjE
MADAAPESRGLFESLKTLAATLLAMAHTRLRLLSTDLEEERERLFSVVVAGLVALFCLEVGVVLVTVFVVVSFWDGNRLLALGTLAGLFLLAGLLALARILYQLKTKPRLFNATLAELAKDREQLSSRS